MFFLLLGAVLAVPIGAVVVKLAKRGRSQPSVRRSHGSGLVDRFAGPPFGSGINRRANVLWRGNHRDREFVVFHYSYDIPEQRNQMVTRTFTVVAMRTPGPCPDLAITRPTLAGGPDVQLESEQFNDAFKIDTLDEKFAYDILHPGMMAWLLDDGRALRMPLTFGNQDLFTYSVGIAGQDHAQAMLDFLCDVLDRVPTFVWNR
jgi:hypothetical protein